MSLGAWAARQAALPVTSPLHLANVLRLVTGGRFVDVELGLLHLSYVAGLGMLTGLLLAAFQPVTASRTFATGSVAGLMSAMVSLPGAAAAGGLTGILVLLPFQLAEIALVGLASTVTAVVLKGMNK